MEDQNITGKILKEWEAPEYAHYEKSADWYWWTGLLAILMLVAAFWQGSFLFGVLVLVGWFTVVIYAARPPRLVRFALTERGVLAADKLYLWQDLKSFWVFYKPPLHNEISIESKKTLMPYIKIPLGEEDPTKLRDTIKKFLPEEEQEESLIDNITHLARF